MKIPIEFLNYIPEVRANRDAITAAQPQAAVASASRLEATSPLPTRLIEGIHSGRDLTGILCNLRSTVGSVLVHIMQRALFWYTSTLRFQYNVAASASELG